MWTFVWEKINVSFVLEGNRELVRQLGLEKIQFQENGSCAGIWYDIFCSYFPHNIFQLWEQSKKLRISTTLEKWSYTKKHGKRDLVAIFKIKDHRYQGIWITVQLGCRSELQTNTCLQMEPLEVYPLEPQWTKE